MIGDWHEITFPETFFRLVGMLIVESLSFKVKVQCRSFLHEALTASFIFSF